MPEFTGENSFLGDEVLACEPRDEVEAKTRERESAEVV